MKIEQSLLTGMIAGAFLAANPAISASIPDATGVPAQMVITVRLAPGGNRSQSLEAGDLKVLEGKTPAPVVGLQRLAGDLADMQLFVFLDDSTRSSSLGTHLPELRTFLESLPATTEVAVGYMRNGTFALAQAFTACRRPFRARMAALTLRSRTWWTIGRRNNRPAAGRC
jgi:hypothetical protein